MLQKYGVDHISKTKKFKEGASKRCIIHNPSLAFNEDNIKTYKYKNTKLTYQGSYEYDFLQLCENLNILEKINNGNVFEYLDKDKKLHNKHILKTDFSLDNYEIEIKSSWILKKQGGPSVLFAKKDAVENTGKKYILILDKDYTEFLYLLK